MKGGKSFMNNKNVISIIGLVATGIGALAGLVGSLASDRKTEYIIDEKIEERFKALTESNEKESE